MKPPYLALLAPIVLLLAPLAAEAQLAVSSNDNKVRLDNGVNRMVPNAPPDTISVIDLKVSPPRVVAEIPVPGSVVGPPTSVAVAPDESIALVTSSTRIDPNDAAKTVPDNRVSVIDLKATPPTVLATLEAGRGAAGVSINRQGTLALVANRGEGTVSVFSIQGKTVTPVGKVTIADEKSGPSHPAFTPDGKMALLTRDGDNKISVLSIDGTKVEYTKRDLNAGLRPYGIDVSSKGDFAAVVMNGSNKAKESPFYNDNGKLVLLRASGMKLSKVAEAPIGHWSQGAAFTADGKTILVGNMVEKDIQVFSWDGSALKEVARLKVNGGPAAVRTAEK
jgi:DNA-binding beta-propeller fold protein YncE